MDTHWKGHFKIGGSVSNLKTLGSLELIDGKYTFSGREFKLTKGLVTFDGKPNAMPTLDIKAKITQQGINIFANVKGNLDTPKITFTSSPPLSAIAIMYLLIFL